MLSSRPVCFWDLDMAIEATLRMECFFGTSTTTDELVLFVLWYPSKDIHMQLS